jgi:amidohydrolase
MNMDTVKESIIQEVDSHSRELRDLSLRIHDNPELGFHETEASRWLTGLLEKNGFRIERGTGGLETAFKATYGNGKPVFAFLAEYDALPGLGHACGHNIICTCAVGAGIAARKAADAYGGTVAVIGTPAEELYGGKIVMEEAGAFENIDFAMMVHPATEDTATTGALACQNIHVEFIGKPAHAAAKPEEGINALEAMILSFNGINSLRQHIRSTARIHGIITKGGEAANIVPASSAGEFIVRAAEPDYLEELKERVLGCFRAGAEATGSELKYTWDAVCYLPMKNNLTIAGLFADNMKQIGRDTRIASLDEKAFGSTDMGNVSQIVPSIHAMVSIADEGVLMHSPEFAQAAACERGMKGMTDAAKAMALTAADVFSDVQLQSAIRKEFLTA